MEKGFMFLPRFFVFGNPTMLFAVVRIIIEMHDRMEFEPAEAVNPFTVSFVDRSPIRVISMEQELIQIFEMLVALWRHSAGLLAAPAEDPGYRGEGRGPVEKEVAEALQFAAESEKDEVVSY